MVRSRMERQEKRQGSDSEAAATFMAFHRGETRFGIAAGEVEQVLTREVVPVEGAPAGLPGFIRLHGQVVPVLDPLAWSGTSAEPAASASSSRVIIVEEEGHRLGILADPETELVRLSAEQVSSLEPEGGSRRDLGGIGRELGKMVHRIPLVAESTPAGPAGSVDGMCARRVS